MELEERLFQNRLELAEFLRERLQGFERVALMRNVGVWSWLALFYFDQIAPRDGEGLRRIYEQARYILTTERRAVLCPAQRKIRRPHVRRTFQR
ncbi:MAG TPA: hypothetical protein VLV78_06585 [Thermoanaerobaculia bacterium]|nr:hypothetical protein [Thermoanaerobaculia bacterium]